MVRAVGALAAADTDVALVAAARKGDRAALDELVTAYFPVVHGIIGRAVACRFDAEDTVQETMANVLRGLPRLRDPSAFRSWLVAITMNQIRKHHRRRRQPESRPPETFDAMPDPAADFAELALIEVALSDQRRELGEAAIWMDDEGRELLSLWLSQLDGRLSRAEIVAALGVDPHVVAVRIGRMKRRLDAARAIVRALAAAPRCNGLAAVTATWTSDPSPLWRKRIGRHVRDCDRCTSCASDLVPVEHLLVDLEPPCVTS